MEDKMILVAVCFIALVALVSGYVGYQIGRDSK